MEDVVADFEVDIRGSVTVVGSLLVIEIEPICIDELEWQVIDRSSKILLGSFLLQEYLPLSMRCSNHSNESPMLQS